MQSDYTLQTMAVGINYSLEKHFHSWWRGSKYQSVEDQVKDCLSPNSETPWAYSFSFLFSFYEIWPCSVFHTVIYSPVQMIQTIWARSNVQQI